ncbi:hypothetical protein GA0115240_10586 [Streptomyces sp. DvalAA-14]|uniref:hypothetical protein n=1 Tax=unclassified Streptomyces TaxID=2593676 RepID=UPI00081B4B58|nr:MULTISPECIES: hypothetical protein [unclassified Streptomyces]MYS19155.1 hypothetical protein [Streptomyces sp. SID4948]SCD38022.1 hypothetical protein GA0115240_10586 [Streptomyces sp. DvalAA-14]
MATATAQPQAATKAPAKKGSAPAPALRPFFTGTVDLETHTYSDQVTLGAGALPYKTYNIRTNGFLADFFLTFTAVTATNAATVAFKENMPLGAAGYLQISDTGGQPVIGPMNSWELSQFVKWGGFSFSDDVRQSQTYSATTGSGATAGSFTMVLHLPIQFVRREPLGPLPNTNSNNAYALDVSAAASTDIYSTAPTNAVTMKMTIHQDAYRSSAGRDAQKNATVTTPPGLGAVLYLRRNTMPAVAGSFDEELSQMEGLYRTLSFSLVDSSGSRSGGESNWPDPAQVFFNNDVPYDRAKTTWVRKMERDYGYIQAIETPGGRENGWFTLPFITDHGLKAGSEDRYKYLSVSAADTLGFRGVIGGSGTSKLTTYYNFVRPPGGQNKALTSR